MKNIMNNMNKLALVALSLFLAVGVISCGCDDKEDKGKTGVKVELSLNKDGKLAKTFAAGTAASLGTPAVPGAGLTDDEVKYELTIKVIEGEITEELAKKIKFSGAKFGEDGKALSELKVTKIENGRDAKIDINWFDGEKDLATLNGKLVIPGDATDDTPALKKERKDRSTKKTATLSGEGITVSKTAELDVTLTPNA